MESQTCPRRMRDAGPWDHEEGLDHWNEESEGFRTCSFCGSLHPQDFMRLVRSRTEIEPTDKVYKFYVHAVDDRVKGAGKFYTQHFMQGGGNEFRELHAANKINWGFPGHPYVPLYVPKTDWVK